MVFLRPVTIIFAIFLILFADAQTHADSSQIVKSANGALEENYFSRDFTQKLIIQIIASVTTLLIGIGLFLLGVFKERKTKRADKRLRDRDLLLHLSLVASRFVALASLESQKLKDTGRKLSESPYTPVELNFNYRSDFQRGINFRTADYLSAYRSEIGRTRFEIECFLRLTSNMEYAAKLYDDVCALYSEKKLAIDKYRADYLDSFRSTVLHIDEMSCRPDYENDPQFVEYLRNLTEGFHAVMNEGDDIYTKAYESAFSPIINSFYVDSELRFGNTRPILLKVESTMSLLNELENSSKALSGNLMEYGREMGRICNEIGSAYSVLNNKTACF